MLTVLPDPTEGLETMTLKLLLYQKWDIKCVLVSGPTVLYKETTNKEVKFSFRGCVQQPRIFIYFFVSFCLSFDNSTLTFSRIYCQVHMKPQLLMTTEAAGSPPFMYTSTFQACKRLLQCLNFEGYSASSVMTVKH